MAPSPRLVKAFRAMRDIGISEDKTKPVLKKLLKVYERNWELIEEENYRALADAIFEEEDSQVLKQNERKNADDENLEEALVQGDSERPLKRLRLRYQERQATPSLSICESMLSEALLKRPKLEEDELLGNSSHWHSLDKTKSAQHNVENGRTETQPVSSQSHTRNMGKQPLSPKPLAVQKLSHLQSCTLGRTEPCATGGSEPNSLSSHIHAGNKGKQPFTPPAVHTKNPKGMVEPGIILLPRQKIPSTLVLIEPKEEPFTDDINANNIPQPIAEFRPDLLSKADYPAGNALMRKSCYEEPPASLEVDTENTGDGENRSNCELTTIPEDSPPSLEIASSPLGEVKISLSCVSALRRPNFHMPTLDELKESMEEKCLRSYKIVDPNFSFIKLMTDMCGCFLDLATNQSHESQEGLSNTLDLLKKSSVRDALRADDCLKNICKGSSTSNGSVDIQCPVEVSAPYIPRSLQFINDIESHIRVSKELILNGYAEIAKGREFKDSDSSNLGTLVVVPQCELTPDELRSLHDVNDITKGEEGVKISWRNEINNERPPSFHYIPKNMVFQNAHVNFPLSRIGETNCCSTCFGDCLSSVVPCACAHETGREFAYTSEGLVKEEILNDRIFMTREKQNLLFCRECPVEKSKNEDILEACKGHLERKIIKECWCKCGCIKQCGNRVVQRGIICKLQVFLTSDGKGWGIRTLEKLPKGAFVCEFVGEILTIRELYERRMQNTNSGKHTCPVLLDAFWVPKGVARDEEVLCLDASFYGNVARFINHRCLDANLIEMPVEVETPDHYYYHLALFTTREVDAMEELTWDYGIDFDDHDHPVKAFRCQCGSKFCRNMKRLHRSRFSSAR
ncbi:SET domain-containing protein/Pre-SET domain-containing protein/WIYLD domain-containing protein [Cephalotus follicularis]|uniref:SET domain-containing protein/Pre-SET domain-containing protein/WIYLD domain-containing protein n=1 Tax=Cephalotus follicularis TaxID=3775 RepID=A0A1Q3CP52_CEPFO|nr:SET domain-containing protein/Pre-SET domain-containing protein/WIYLD domain-containing protein [Cephalotus follicularis]